MKKYKQISSKEIGIPEIDESLDMILEVNEKYMMPLLIRLHEDYIKGGISKEEYILCVKLIEASLVKLMIQDKSLVANKLRTIFISFDYDKWYNQI